MIMSWFDFWSQLIQSRRTNTAAKPSGSVHDELMFHFRELLNERLTEGQTFDVAWDEAEKRFGSVCGYENECHAVQVQKWLTGQMLVALVALVLVAGGMWSLFEMRGQRLRNDLRLLRNTSLRHEQTQTIAEGTQSVLDLFQPVSVDLVGQITDTERQPLADATVLVILKTWPNGQYQQKDHTATTDENGRFVLPKLVPAHSKYAIQVAALKEGFAFHSFYHLKESQFEKLQPVTLQLEAASSVTLVVRDNSGEPIPNVNVIPFAREPQGGSRHQVYFQGAEPIRRTTDAEGRVQFGCFLKGDSAEICVQLPGQDWGNRAFEVSTDNILVDLASTAIVVN
jgi:hypothetical protein